MFGVVFPNRSFPIDISTFTQIDTFHWVLDMKFFVGKNPSLHLSLSLSLSLSLLPWPRLDVEKTGRFSPPVFPPSGGL